jgi:hypothetical protein
MKVESLQPDPTPSLTQKKKHKKTHRKDAATFTHPNTLTGYDDGKRETTTRWIHSFHRSLHKLSREKSKVKLIALFPWFTPFFSAC